MHNLTFKIRGTTSLLMHNSRLSNPLDDFAKAMKKISGKRKKTDDDLLALSRTEFMGGLYWDSETGIHIPGENIEACLLAAFKLKRLGTAFKRGGHVVNIQCPLTDTGGPQTPKELWEDERFRHIKSVKVGTSRVMRTRPQFDKWALEFTVAYDPAQLEKEDIEEAVKSAGEMVGLGDWRPRHGKFEIVEK